MYIRDLVPHLHLIRRIARKMRRRLPRGVELSDLISDGFIGLNRAARRFDPSRGTPFSLFACRCIKGAMLDGLRQRDWLPRQIRTGKSPPPVVRSLSLELIYQPMFEHRVQWRASIDDLLRPLSQRARLIVQLYHFEKMNMPQIAEVLGVTISRVSQLHRRSLKAIRERLTSASTHCAAHPPAHRPLPGGRRSRPSPPEAAPPAESSSSRKASEARAAPATSGSLP